MEGAWLGPEMIEAYTLLHEQGFAASVEIWKGEQLVGGLYGVTLARCFFGESMFSLVPSASKLALIHLAQFFGEHGGVLIDCQFETPHLKSMGGSISATKNIWSFYNHNYLRWSHQRKLQMFIRTASLIVCKALPRKRFQVFGIFNAIFNNIA